MSTIEAGRLSKGVTWEVAAAALVSGQVVSGEFCEWARGFDGLADLDTMDVVALASSLAQADMRAIFTARESAIVARVKAEKGKGGRVKTVCPVSAGEFVANGQPLVLVLPSGDEFACDPRVFKIGDGATADGKECDTREEGGSFGWQANAEVFVDVGGKRCKVSLNVCGIVANSGDAPRHVNDAERAALAKHCGVYLDKLVKARVAIAERKAKAAAKAAG